MVPYPFHHLNTRRGTTASHPTCLRQAWVALTGLSAVFLFEMLDNSVLNVALPTIGRDLRASAGILQWVTGSYAVVFGGLMLALGALADKVGRKKTILIGLVLLAAASLATACVTTVAGLIAVRVVMGVAAAMTTPGSLALAFRLFDDDKLRVQATTVISTVGVVGMAIGPVAGGFALAFVPWQALLMVNAPIAVIAFLAIRVGVPVDRADELHHEPIDGLGAICGTLAITGTLVVPTVFMDCGIRSWTTWASSALTILLGGLFVVRESRAQFPLIDLALITRPLVSSGLAFKAAASLAVSGLGFLVTLQLQYAWGWSASHAAEGTLPQVAILIVGGAAIRPLISRLGMEKTSWMGAITVVGGLAIYGSLGWIGYEWVATALILVAAGMRVVGVVAGTTVMRGLPADRTTVGAALVDTSGELATGIGIAISGTIIAAWANGPLVSLTPQQTVSLQQGIMQAGIVLTILAAALVSWGITQANRSTLVRRLPA